MSDPVHLHEELGLDSLTGLVLAFASVSSHGVHLVYEDDAGLLLPGHVEQGLNYLFTLSHVLAHDVAA